VSALVAKELQEQNEILRQIFERAYLDKIYPVGSIYMSVNATNPSGTLGGTWEQIKDRFLLAAGNNYSAGSTGGSATVKLTIDEMPAHTHKGYLASTAVTSSNYAAMGYDQNVTDGGTARQSVTYAGGDKAHENMPPYLAVYMWKRIG
jgi:hypothetical protein